MIGAGTPAGRQVLSNLQAGGFAGTVLAVSDRDAVASVQAYPDIASLPIAPELAVFAGEADRVAADAAALAARGSFAGIVVTPGGDLAAVARATGMRLLGPDRSVSRSRRSGSTRREVT